MKLKKKWEQGRNVVSNWIIDISKYVMTGVVLTSVFKDFESKSLLYIVGILISCIGLLIGIIVKTDKEDKK
ncbi:hypothetical protein AGMMS4957_21280 [Bacteroidia bacterium]|nr:hypothetical protein AGMMS4957_21280 [Bacteroidia bacterium]